MPCEERPASGDRKRTVPLAELLVVERFTSLQGEGPTAGMPAAFLRLGRCNLACGFCDTPYSWDFERYSFSEEVHAVSFSELSDWVLRACPGRLVVTGGEPLIQQKALGAWLQELRDLGRLPVVEVETNGTIVPDDGLTGLVSQWNVSVKLENSGEPHERRIRPRAISWFAREQGAFFKFVVTGPADAEEAIRLLADFDVPRERALFMPLSTTPEELSDRGPKVALAAVSAGVRYSSRLHLHLYGGKRGH